MKGTSEADLYRIVITNANRITSKAKQTLVFYLDYLKDFEQLEKAKKENLKREGKITEAEYKTWSLLDCPADEKDIVRKKTNLDKIRAAHKLVDNAKPKGSEPEGIRQQVQALQENYLNLINRINTSQKPKDALDE